MESKESGGLLTKPLILIGIIFISAIAVSAYISNQKHNSGNILMNVNGHKMTLKEAIENNFISKEATPDKDYTTSVLVGHNANEIWVSVDGNESTLEQAINGAGLCGSSIITSYSNPKPNPGHYADEVEITINGDTKTLQQAIDDGDFCNNFVKDCKADGGEIADCGGTLCCKFSGSSCPTGLGWISNGWSESSAQTVCGLANVYPSCTKFTGSCPTSCCTTSYHTWSHTMVREYCYASGMAKGNLPNCCECSGCSSSPYSCGGDCHDGTAIYQCCSGTLRLSNKLVNVGCIKS